MRALFDPKSPPDGLPTLGGKALNLLRLEREGHRVPDWVAIPAEGFLDVLEADGLGARVAQCLARLDDGNAAAIAADVQALILAAPLPEWLPAALGAAAIVTGAGAGYLAVRSSAADEDGAAHSFAGIHESFLYVRGPDAAAQHVRRVWASGYQERALLYRRANRLPLHPVPMAVVLQAMVNAEPSGVAFTADPAAGDPFILVISALWGLG